ncbi:MAG: hypothetical protein QOF02_917 [Blastocatellia bacterium]|jgi:hypothetical protein|nr:hypothetical protein [Blastocatellia bacterium]
MRASIIALMVCAVLCVAVLTAARTPEPIVRKDGAVAAAQRRPSVTLKASATEVLIPCPEGRYSDIPACDPNNANLSVELEATAKGFRGRTSYLYSTSGGRIEDEGPKVKWDLLGAMPGTYTASVEVRDERGNTATASVNVTIKVCQCRGPACPVIVISGPTNVVQRGAEATVTVNINHAPRQATFNWAVSAGTISRGQGTMAITIDTRGVTDDSVTATLEVGGLSPECERTGSSTFAVGP